MPFLSHRRYIILVLNLAVETVEEIKCISLKATTDGYITCSLVIKFVPTRIAHATSESPSLQDEVKAKTSKGTLTFLQNIASNVN